jgi:hypothetical protein
MKSQLVEVFAGYGKLGFTNNYVDEEGRQHFHDPNFSLAVYRCSMGHEVKYHRYNRCSGCAFNGGETRVVNSEDFVRELL